MAQKTIKMSIVRQILIGHVRGISIRKLAENYRISRNTVRRYIRIAEEDALGMDGLLSLDDPELDHRFNSGAPAYCDRRFTDLMERMPYLMQELGNKDVTDQLLWEEYRREVPDGYSLSQFRFHLRQNDVAAKPSVVLKILHQPADMMYIDFAGKKLSYVDMETGENVPVETFVSVLPYSGYTFVRCIPSQRIEHFLSAVDAAIRFYGGAPRMIVPDNLRSAVRKPGRVVSKITDGLLELASHYRCCVQPARPYKPKDKAPVEDAVHKSYTNIYAPLRKRTFHSIDEINEAISPLLEKYNARRMTGCDYSRVERFVSLERPALLPLPDESFDMKQSARLKVLNNGFILLSPDRHYYSVPYHLTGEKVEVVYTATIVRIFHNHICVATHPRSFRKGEYTFVEEHLSPQARAISEYSPQFFIDKAARHGSFAVDAMRKLFSGGYSVSYYYHQAQSILSLGRNAEPETFRMACKIATELDKCDYEFILQLVKTKCRGYLELHSPEEASAKRSFSPSSHSNIRGPQAFR